MARMTEFDYDVRDRKRIASMAKYKKNGSKSKKCSLPSDGMTKKQWTERCGELMSFNIKKPMTWEQFKSMPHDIQKEYITNLTTTYNVGLPKVADMLGCCDASLRYYLKKYVPDFVSRSSGGRQSKENMAAWAEFLENGMTDPAPVAETTQAQETAIVAEVADEACVVPSEPSEPICPKADMENGVGDEEQPTVAASEKKKTLLREFSLSFDGAVDPMAIANSLTAILGSNATGRIEVRFAR